MLDLRFVLALCGLVSFVLAACVTPAVPGGQGAPNPVRELVTWYQYDQDNEDPLSDERVGNEYLRQALARFNADFAGKWRWVNQPKAWDRMQMELIAAVQAGGDVPDVMQIYSTDIQSHYQHGSLQDIGAWAEAQPWYADLDASTVAICRGPDGGLYCIPLAQMPQLVFVWRDRYPDGYPRTPDEFLAQAEALKQAGWYAITFFGSTDFDGAGATRFVWAVVSSFGGAYDDGAGNMQLNRAENIAAVEFMRTIVANGYAPEIAFAGRFQEEQAFKDASAGSFPTGVFGYRYLNPLTAPNGTVYGKGNEEDMLDAIAAGDIFLAPLPAVEGSQPGCGVTVTGLAIPTGASNVVAAQDYINWVMQPEENAAWVLGPGGGFPALAATQQAGAFQTPFYREAARVVAQSACRPWYGTLERRIEAQKLIMATIYKLIKEDPAADIATALAAAETEYNGNR